MIGAFKYAVWHCEKKRKITDTRSIAMQLVVCGFTTAYFGAVSSLDTVTSATGA